MNMNPVITDDLIEQFRSAANPSQALSVRVFVAASPLCPPDILARLARDSAIPVVASVAENPVTPGSVRQYLSQHEHQDVLVAYCLNPTTTPDDRKQVMTRLKNATIVEMAGFKRSLPADILQYLGANENYVVRNKVASRPDLPMALLERLNGDSVNMVRKSTLYNPHITHEMVQRLANDEVLWVKGAAICSGKLPAAQVVDMMRTSSDGLMEYVAEHFSDSSLPSLILDIYSHRETPPPLSIMLAMIANKSTPRAILQQLYHLDKSEDLQWKLSGNKNIGWQLMAQLAFGSEVHALRDSVISEMEEMGIEDWDRFIADGLTLDAQITQEHKNNQMARLGDCFLEAGLGDAYQYIQSIELQHQVDAATSNQATHRDLPSMPLKICF